MLRIGIDVEFRRPQPSPHRAALRALALAAIACRVALENDVTHAEAHDLHRHIHQWLIHIGVDGEFEHTERDLFLQPLGTLSHAQMMTANLHSVGTAVLAWGLKAIDLPEIDVELDVVSVIEQLGWLNPNAATLFDSLRLRPRSDMVSLAEQLEVAQWWLDYSAAGSTPPSLTHFRFAIDSANATCIRLGPDGTPWIDGAPLAQASAERAMQITLSVRARRRALLWLLGQAELYSTIDTDI